MSSSPDSRIETNELAENGILAVEARNLYIYYANFLAVKNVSLPVSKTKITAIIGPLRLW
jgi:ABC-type phosphate transport system ATPase subunit